MASTKDITPEVLEMFDLDNPYTIDQSFGSQIYSATAPRGNPNSAALVYDISKDAMRLSDLANSYNNVDLTIALPAGTNMTPNMQLALSNNALMYLFSTVQLQTNGTTIEEITNEPGTFTAMQNLLWYSKEYSKSANALTENCWQIDDNSFFTTLAAGHARCPNYPIANQAQAATLSSGMANSVNGIKCQVNMPTAGTGNAQAVDTSYVDTLGPNKKYSSGFKARHDILFNQLAGANDNSVNIAYDGNTNTVKVVFKLMLSHIIMTLKTCNKVFRGGQILITLNTDTANLYKAFNIDRTPITATGQSNTAIQTWPPSQAAVGAGWSQNFNNVASPWVDMSDPAGAYKMGNFTITWNDATLYLRIVQPKYAIYAKIMEEYVPHDKPAFYNAITTVGSYTGLTTSSQQTVILGTTFSNADYLVFAFQIKVLLLQKQHM
jgi:hypothetical protein